MKNRKLGIIGGSGLYKMEGFEKPKWKKVETPGETHLISNDSKILWK